MGPLLVLNALAEMESQRNDLKHILSLDFVVFLQIIEQSFLVSNVPIIDEMVVD